MVTKRSRIGVIGGGMMGLALAERLCDAGAEVVVYEQADQLGGLATYHDFGKFWWDRFYHVILPSDGFLVDYLSEIGLQEELRWETTLTGFYADSKSYSVSDSVEFLKFPVLNLFEKARLAFTLLYCSRIKDWERLEKQTVEQFLCKVSGKSVYQKLWRPLLLAKLGESYREVSAVFIWSYVKRMFSARHSSAKKEQLGHVAGGYKSVFERIEKLILERGGRINLGSEVKSLKANGVGLEVESSLGTDKFDRIVFTSTPDVLRRLSSPELVSVESRGDAVQYLGVVCVVVVSRKPLMPFYVLNIIDRDLPFTGVIGMSNVVSTEETSGLHMTYFPKYVLSSDEFLNRSDDDIREEFMAGIRKMFPDLSSEDIESVHINRAKRVQPLQVVGYSKMTPAVKTRHPGFYVLNTAQSIDNTLNNNEVIKSVGRFMSEYGASLLETDTP